MKNEKAKRFIGILIRRLKGTEVSSTSVMIAYYLLLSFFPLLIAAGNTLALFNVDTAVLLGYISVAVPAPVQEMLLPIIRDVLAGTSGGLLSVSAVVVIWSASRGISYIQKGVNKAYGVPANGNYLAKRLVSIVTILLVLVVLVAFVLLFSLGEMLLEALSPDIPAAGRLLISILGLKWPVTLLFMFLLLLIIYRVTPDVKLRLRHAVPGALLATAGLSALVQGFTVFVQFSTRSFSSYRVLSTLFVMMFWLDFSMVIVLVGAALNAAIFEYRFGAIKEDTGPVDEALERIKDALMARLRRLMGRRGAGEARGETGPAEKPEPPATPGGGTDKGNPGT